MENQSTVLSILVENNPGVLARVAGLFSRRGFNIDSLTVGETQDPKISRMTVAVTADRQALEQIKKQVNKLVDVIKVIELHSGSGGLSGDCAGQSGGQSAESSGDHSVCRYFPRQDCRCRAALPGD